MTEKELRREPGGLQVPFTPAHPETSIEAEPRLPTEWDYEADVVVVGTGAAGLAAAWVAADSGVDVLVLEKGKVVGPRSSCSAISGGTCSMVGTPLQREKGIKDSPDLYYEDLIKVGKGWAVPDVVRAFVDEDAKLYPWLIEELGIEVMSFEWSVGHSVPRKIRFNPAKAIKIVKEDAERKGAKILLETPGRRLITNGCGRVVGIIAENRVGKKIYVKVRKGVILATGGFCNGEEYMRNYGGIGLELCILQPPWRVVMNRMSIICLPLKYR